MILKERADIHRLISVQTRDGPRMIPCLVERSRRLRRMVLQFDCPDYVTLKLPPRSAEKSGLHFIQEHADWICGVLDAKPAAKNLQQYLARHPRLALCGYWHGLELQFVPLSSGFQVVHDQRVIRIALDKEAAIEEQLKSRLRQIAREYLPRRVKFLEPKVGVKAHGITIRDQKSRWGSCSETSALSLNWRLILLSPRLQDHVLLHELAHIRHFDHSAQFHAFLRLLDPQARRHARRLNQPGATSILAVGR